MEVDQNDAPVESESDSFDEKQGVDPKILRRVENAVGKAAVERKGCTVDEEEASTSREVDNKELFAMDEPLAAAFKSIAPKKENEMAAR